MSEDHGVTAEEMEMLSEEERAAIEAEDDASPSLSNDEQSGQEGNDNPDDTPGQDDVPSEGGEGANEDETPADAGGEEDKSIVEEPPTETPKPEEKPVEEVKAPEKPAEQPKPAPKQSLPTMPDEVPAEFKGRLDELDSKLERGDITLRQYNDGRDSINRQIWNHQIQQSEAKGAQEQWQADQDAFFAVEENKQLAENPLLFDQLNAAVKSVSNAAMTSNEQLTGAEILVRAKNSVAAIYPHLFKKEQQPKKDDPPPAVPNKEDPKPTAKRPAIPSLGDMPAADTPDTKGGEFAHLDNLTGIEYEAALENLSDEARKRYMDGK